MRGRVMQLTVGILMLAGAVCALAADQLEAPIVKDGMSIALPKGWAVEEPKAGRTILVGRSKENEKDESGEFPTTISVGVSSSGKPDGKAIQEANAKELKNYKAVEEPREVDLGGASGVVLGGTFTRGALKLRTRQYVLTAGEKGYVVTIVMLESRWEKSRQAAEVAVATFKIVTTK